MKKLFVAGIFIWVLTAVIFAQSGRRVKSSAPAKSPVVTTADTVAVSDDTPQNSVGYSESASNRSRNISARGNEKKPKKESKANTAATTPAASSTSSSGDDDVLKIETNLITLPVSVYDRNGLYIPNLQQKNFKIFEDGKEQEVAYFGKTDNPFTVVLLIDVSASAQFKIEQIQSAAYAFVDQLEPQDRVIVMSFDSSVDTLTKEPTSDRNLIRQAIAKTKFGGGTSLYDAVDSALRKQLAKIEGRKAVVLFTDGVDSTSRSSYERTVREAEESEAVIFPIYYNTYLQMAGIGGGTVMSTPATIGIPNSREREELKQDYAVGRAYLQELAEATGGRVYRPESTPGGLNAAFEGIAEELRRQYSIGYYPQEEGAAGQRKQIKVRVDRPNLVIRTRDSYIVGEAAKAQNAK